MSKRKPRLYAALHCAKWIQETNPGDSIEGIAGPGLKPGLASILSLMLPDCQAGNHAAPFNARAARRSETRQAVRLSESLTGLGMLPSLTPRQIVEADAP